MKTLLFAFVAAIAAATASAEVIELNTNNFHSVIGDASKDVFVMFHAPWCAHCQKLKPEFEKLGDITDASKFTIASLDADAEEHRGFARQNNIREYPTLLLFPKGDKGNPRQFTNKLRKASDMRLWLQTGRIGGAFSNNRK